jgi:hypothetical protein
MATVTVPVSDAAVPLFSAATQRGLDLCDGSAALLLLEQQPDWWSTRPHVIEALLFVPPVLGLSKIGSVCAAFNAVAAVLPPAGCSPCLCLLDEDDEWCLCLRWLLFELEVVEPERLRCEW